VDTEPVKVKGEQVESYFVTKFDEIFPIKKHKIETLFAGKISAILGREFAKGRDYYDLIWYMTKKTEIDMGYLNASINRIGFSPFKNKKEVFEHLSDVVAKTRPEVIMKDIARFLEDPKEAEWIKNYQDVFKQLMLV
jgi:predicted nucleotidyltransferase component of viral defense system